MQKITKVVATVAIGAAVVATAAACSSSGSTSSSTPKPVVAVSSLSGISTSVALDSGFLSALKTLKLTPATVGTAKLSSSGVISFPITGGHVKVYKKGAVKPYVQGIIDHDGSGLSLTAGKTTVTLENFVINPGNNSELTGKVLLNGKVAAASAKLFNLDGSTLKTPSVNTSTGVATLTGTTVYLSNVAAGLLDKVFKTTAVKGGLLIGVATIQAK